MIADFGGARFMNRQGKLGRDTDSVAVMTVPYAAPEVIKCFAHSDPTPYDHRADYWSLAVVFVAMLFGTVSSLEAGLTNVPLIAWSQKYLPGNKDISFMESRVQSLKDKMGEEKVDEKLQTFLLKVS